MSRLPREYSETLFFHIITQGNNKNYIFKNSIDIRYYISIMYKLAQNQNIKIIAYCIMNNHAHMLLKVRQTTELSLYMLKLNTAYAQYYNKKYNKVGHVFRDRYKSEGIYGEEQLCNCINYIYNNPVKANICNLPWEYPYSNYKKYNKQTNNNYSFLEIDDEDDICKKAIEKVLLKYNLNISELKRNEYKLKMVVKELKEKNKISLRKIAEKLHVNREFIRKIYKI